MAFLVIELTYCLSATSTHGTPPAIRSSNFANNGHLESGLVLVGIWSDDGTSHDQSRDDGAEKGRHWR